MVTQDSYTPSDLSIALKVLSEASLKPYAGGSDLMVAEKHDQPFLFLQDVPELRQLYEDDESIHIGAGLSYTELLSEPLTPALLKEAISTIAAPAIRNVATLGGNIANASPKGDGALICFVADACLRLMSHERGERILGIQEFYQGRGKTQLAADELLIEIILPKQWLGEYSFTKVGARKALAISRVSFAGLLHVEAGIIDHLALAFGAVEDVVVRRPEIDAMLIGRTLAEARELTDEYLAVWDKAIDPIQGRVSASYRKQVCLNLAADFIESRLA